MSTAVTIFMAIIGILGLIILSVFIYVSTQFCVFFYLRNCSYCGHRMEYRGIKDDSNNGHYLFHCPKCGAWEQVPREEFIRSLDDNPLEK